MSLQTALQQALESHKDAILAFSQDLIRIPSQNPPGCHYRKCADRIRLELGRLGLPAEVVEVPGYSENPRYNVLSFYGNAQPTLYFSGHFDVVPAYGTEQFRPWIENGRLYGRGASDMKPALATMMYAA